MFPGMAALDLLKVEMSKPTIHFHIDSQGAMKSLETFFTKQMRGRVQDTTQQTHRI